MKVTVNCDSATLFSQTTVITGTTPTTTSSTVPGAPFMIGVADATSPAARLGPPDGVAAAAPSERAAAQQSP